MSLQICLHTVCINVQEYYEINNFNWIISNTNHMEILCLFDSAQIFIYSSMLSYHIARTLKSLIRIFMDKNLQMT